MVGVVALGPGGVQVLILLLVVGLLEEDVGANARLFQLAVVLHGGGGDVHIHPADGSVLVVDGVDGVDALQQVLHGVVHRVLAGLQGQTLVAHVLEGHHLPDNLLLGELFPGNVLVLAVVGAVFAAVDAVVGQVQGGKHDDTVAVELLLDAPRQVVHPLHQVGLVALEEHRRLPVRQALAVLGLFQQLLHQGPVIGVFLSIGQGVPDFSIVDEFLGDMGFGIVLHS